MFLYYGLTIDNKILVAFNDISLEQSSATKNTSKYCKTINYLAKNSNASLQYHASVMILYFHSDTSYLSITKAQIRAGGVHFLSDAKP